MALSNIPLKLVVLLVKWGRLTEETKAALVASETRYDERGLELELTEKHKITPFEYMVAKAKALDLYPINFARHKISQDVYSIIPEDFCKEHGILPLGTVGDNVLVVVHNPFDHQTLNRIGEITHKNVIRYLAREKEITARFPKKVTEIDIKNIDTASSGSGSGDEKNEEVSEESAPIIQLANRIIEDAHALGSSDIHLDPQEHDMVVRYRIDGNLQEKLRIPRKVGPGLVARLKIMCNLDISERRKPQDGRIVFKKYTKSGIDIDLRVSTAPLNHGEGMVMRILDKQKSTLPLPALGFSEANLAKYRECIQQPYGMILHCGPTGSGKSMTLYSALGEINTPDICIRTAEDPIEYTLAGINQMQMHKQIDLTFATALRAFLRQDPDIILVGEIRDKETAGIAIEAALTGHLLISTLHTNDAPSTIARLTDMGIEPFMISSSLVCVCAQRLLRRVCKTCRQPYTPEGREADILQRAIGWTGTIYRSNPKGCPKCGGSGYKGRCGIHELMVSSEELISAINKEMETAVLKEICMRTGMKTLHQDSMLKVKDGITTLNEALANVPQDMELKDKPMSVAIRAHVPAAASEAPKAPEAAPAPS